MQHILSKMRQAIEEYQMIEEGDKIAVCLSGGKDSITLLNALKEYKKEQEENKKNYGDTDIAKVAFPKFE